MEFDDDTKRLIERAWHQQSAHASVERWFELCEKENWGGIPEDMSSLIRTFGASWYFTRYIFYRGREAAELIDSAQEQKYDLLSLQAQLLFHDAAGDVEQRLERLRLSKNALMLQILVCYLDKHRDQKETEQALTHLAVATLNAVLGIYGLDSDSSLYRLSILGMGRMAGDEMTFGSDLDLIFLYESVSLEGAEVLGKKVRQLLRSLSMVSSAGALYDVDMRLRTHGTSGALLTTVGSFLEYHQSDREIWERQMMTRCCPVTDQDGIGKESLTQILPLIYAEYDETVLREEIAAMRNRVEEEKGTVRNKYNVKQGRGGLMDVDFLCHYLQLKHGRSNEALRASSTREVLGLFASHGLLTTEISRDLLDAYDFLKQVEACVRLFDMKPISTISDNPSANHAIARAMGFDQDVEGFMEKYRSVTESVRSHFVEVVGTGK